MELEKIRNLSDEELAHQEKTTSEQLFRSRFQVSLQPNEGVRKLQQLRKEIARIKTVAREGTNTNGGDTATGSDTATGGDTAIGGAGSHLPGRGQMSRSQTSIAGHGPGIDLQALQVGVQQETAARSRFPVDDRDILAAQIFDSADSLRISPSRENTFLPHGKRKHGHRLFGKQARDFRDIGLAGYFVPQMRARDVDAALLEE